MATIANAVTKARGKVIEQITLTEDTLTFVFTNGTALKLDIGEPSCCEHLYFHCDDDLSHHLGTRFEDIRIEEGPTTGDVLESEFLHIVTSNGVSTVVAYNSHNGYYGGISVTAQFMAGGTF